MDDHQKEQWWGGHFRCDNTRCGFEGDRGYIGALNVTHVFFSETDELDHMGSHPPAGGC
jgi:hypothetical protein